MVDEDSSTELAPKKITLVVPNIHERERIDKFLARQVVNTTRSKVQTAIDEERILVNGKHVKANHKLAPGDVIEVTFTHPPAPDMKPEDIPLNVVFEDDFLIVINKPAGMVVHPAFGNWTGTLANAVLFHAQSNLSDMNDDELRPGIVHRLDKDTSGLIVVAKDNHTHEALSKQFAARTTEKNYLALVFGVPKNESGTIETNIARSKRDRKVMANYPFNGVGGKHAVTDYVVAENYGFFSLLSLKLHTGRTHQIRVHLQHIGHSIVGDEVYGGRTIRPMGFPQSDAFLKNLFDILPRQALHAAELSFVHPHTKQRASFSAALPHDISQAVQKIKTIAHVR